MREILQIVLDLAQKFWLEVILLVILTIFLGLWGFPIGYTIALFVAFLVMISFLNSSLISGAFLKGIRDMYKERFSTAFIVVLILLMVIWSASIELIAFVTLFFAFLLYPWDNRIIAFCAMVCLAACPFLLIYNQENLAEQMATYAYYFLVITVVLQIVEYKRTAKHAQP